MKAGWRCLLYSLMSKSEFCSWLFNTRKEGTAIPHRPMLHIGRCTLAVTMEKMIAFSNGNLRDMNHLMCVWTYAKTIGELEGLDRKTQETLEIAAITHDIACPLCREKYGNTNGKRQEEEGGPLVRSFLADAGLSAEQVDRVAYLVSHHHTYTDIDGIDYQILIEADYIVNASESGYSPENRKNFLEEHVNNPRPKGHGLVTAQS